MSTCLGTTVRGTLCRVRPAEGGNGYCGRHQDQAAAARDTAPGYLDRLAELDAASVPVRRSEPSSGGQGGRSLRLAVSRRQKRPDGRSTVVVGGGQQALCHAVRADATGNHVNHAAARASLAAYRAWTSDRTR